MKPNVEFSVFCNAMHQNINCNATPDVELKFMKNFFSNHIGSYKQYESKGLHSIPRQFVSLFVIPQTKLFSVSSILEIFAAAVAK